VLAEGTDATPLIRDQNKGKALVHEDMVNDNKELVPVVDEEVDDSNSEASEFVEDTQLEDEGDEVDYEDEVSNIDKVTQNEANMEFLRQSWENIADNANAQDRLLADIEKGHDMCYRDFRVSNH